MRQHASHPPSTEAAERYRREGFWRPGRTPAAWLADIAAAGTRVALADGHSEWTYDQLAAAIGRTRERLTDAGVTVEDSVLIVAPLRNAAAAAYLATVQHGAVAVLLDRRCGEADVLNAVNAAPRIALAFEADAQRLRLHDHCRVVYLDCLGTDAGSVAADDVVADPDLPAVVVFTSGTTSTPKGVVHTINSLRCGTANMLSALDIGPDDVFLLSSPLASITGVLQLESALAKHAKVVLQERFSASTALDSVLGHRVTVIGGAPAVMEAVFSEADRRRCQALPLRCIAVGGAMIPQHVLNAARRFGITPVRVYGSSEVPFSTATSLGNDDDPRDDGAPLPGVEVSVRDTDDTDELLIRGPHQFHGYLDPAHNVGAFAGDWVRTGDQADVRTGRVTVKGRLKEIVIRKGSKISLAEIDTAANGLGECAAFGLPDPVTGERLALAIRTTQDVSYAKVVEHLTATGLAKWKLPEQIVLWDGELPRTASGKINRGQLAEDSTGRPTRLAPRLDGLGAP